MPPTEEEHHNKNRRMIDGKVHHYVYETKRWVIDKSQPQGANVAEGTAAASTTTTSASANTASLDSKQQLALANASRMFEQALSNLATQLKES
jgi:hypothetical protein